MQSFPCRLTFSVLRPDILFSARIAVGYRESVSFLSRDNPSFIVRTKQLMRFCLSFLVQAVIKFLPV